MNCLDCDGYGEDGGSVDLYDYCLYPTCDSTGKVAEGTKSWMQKLFEEKE